jgi:hypothetical protein
MQLQPNPHYDFTDEKLLHYSRPLSIESLEINGVATTLEIQTNGPTVFAFSPAHQRILSYADFTPPASMFGPSNGVGDTHTAYMELFFLKTDPECMGCGLRGLTLEWAKRCCAAIPGRIPRRIVLRPERPGSELSSEERDYRFPRSTEQLREFYLKRGFRPFTEEEIRFCVIMIDAHSMFASYLCHEDYTESRTYKYVKQYLIQES